MQYKSRELFKALKKDIANCSLAIADTQKKYGLPLTSSREIKRTSVWTKEGWTQNVTSIERTREVYPSLEKRQYEHESIPFIEECKTKDLSCREFFMACELFKTGDSFTEFLNAAITICEDSYLSKMETEADEIKGFFSNYKRKITKQYPQEEIDALEIYIERQIQEIFNPYFSCFIDLEIYKENYSSPKEKLEDILLSKEENIETTTREDLFTELLSEADMVKTNSDLFGEEGLYWKAKPIYLKDRTIILQWNKDTFKEDKQSYLARQKRNKFLDSYSWILYGQEEKENSIWFKKRDKEFLALALTKDQWSFIVLVIKNLRRRIRCNLNPDKRRNESITFLRAQYKKIETIEDLNNHIKTNQSRAFFKLSVIDSLSIKDEENWHLACMKKRNILVEKILKEQTSLEKI